MKKDKAMEKKVTSKNERDLIAFLRAEKETLSPLLILTHDFPDPDALAGAWALQYVADRVCGIRSRIVYRGVIGRAENRNMVSLLGLPVHRLRPGELKRSSRVALIDTQPEFENNPFPDKGNAAIVIDQHQSVTRPSADFAIIDTKCGATSIIMARALLSIRDGIPEKLATALAYGIISDTLNLYRTGRRDIMSTYLKILPYADMHILARIQTPVHERAFFMTLQRAISCARLTQGLMVCHLSQVSSPDVTSQTADFLLSYKGAQWVLTTGRYRNRLHVSLRSKNMNFNAGRVLRLCFDKPEDAGGHDNVGGGSMRIAGPGKQKWRVAENTITERVMQQLNLKKGPFPFPFSSPVQRGCCD
ncbi:MAG: DHH family phosphoesterase [Nitrospiraceae bacterium]|nr:MAG: DHH family phosphoesterase [Nitrospiraceae bacterium]